jgi:hypothetical protein
MALAAVTSGSNATALSVQQIINLLTGVMTDQPVYVANTIRAGGPGATTFAAFLGGIASGTVPGSGAHAVGEFLLDVTNQIFRMCTVAGSPGTWVAVGTQTDLTAGDYVLLVAGGASSVAGATGKAADAGHQHPAKVNPAGGYTGNLFWGQLGGVDKFTVDQTGLLTLAGGGVFAGPLSGITTLAMSGALSGLTNISMSGALTGATGVTATNLTGTLQTAAQPNITSLGTITSLVASAFALAAAAGNTVQTLGNSGTYGSKHWIQTTDPGASAANGDTWDNTS